MIMKNYFIFWLDKWKLGLINIQVGELSEVETEFFDKKFQNKVWWMNFWASNFLELSILWLKYFHYRHHLIHKMHFKSVNGTHMHFIISSNLKKSLKIMMIIKVSYHIICSGICLMKGQTNAHLLNTIKTGFLVFCSLLCSI